MAPRPPAELEQQAARNAAVRALAAQQLTSLWPRVDFSSDLAAQAVTMLYRAIVAQFGSTAATLAADFYDDQRGGRGLRRRYRASVAEPVNDVQIRAMVESAFLGTDEPLDVRRRRRVRVKTSELPVDQRVPQRLDQSLSRLVMQPARDTIALNVERDPAKPTWLRVPTGETTCEFCIMLASRELGPHFRGYASRERAIFDDNGDKFHDWCDCEPVACFPGDDPNVLSPNLRDYLAIYQKGSANAGTRSDAKAVLAGMRKVLKTQQPPPPARRDEPTTTGVQDLDTPRARSDGGDRPPPTQPATPPPAPPDPPNPPAVAAGDGDDEPIVVGQPAFGDDVDPPTVDVAHVLDGDPDDVTKGGHRFGTGRPNKTEFPQAWPDDVVLAAIAATMERPTVTDHGGDRTNYLREVDGVIVLVSTYFDGTTRVFRAAYPINGVGVVYNPPDGGPAVDRPLDRSVIEDYR